MGMMQVCGLITAKRRTQGLASHSILLIADAAMLLAPAVLPLRTVGPAHRGLDLAGLIGKGLARGSGGRRSLYRVSCDGA